MAGHIKLDRKILQWEWYQDANTCRLFIHLLLMANYKESRWQGRIISRGQVIIGTEKLALILKLGRQEIRTSLNKLKITNEITITVTNKYSIVTICKYDTYQSFDDTNNHQTNQQLTNNQPTTNQQLTTSNKVINKEEYNNNKINTGGENSPPPRTPYEVPGFNYLPEGRSYIEPTIFYKASDFNGLPDENIKSVIDFFDATKSIALDPERVTKSWEVFKTNELTEQKPYRNHSDVYRHFMNWCKKQTFVTGKKERIVNKSEIKTSKIIGIEFLNNFSQCRMSDGTIQTLNTNQQDLAKYNQINPNAILKS
jgi:hypothetical protein